MAYHKGGKTSKHGGRKGGKRGGSTRKGGRKHGGTRKNTGGKRGGSVMSSAVSVAHKALLPYVMYKAQKHQQKRVGARKSRSTRRRR